MIKPLIFFSAACLLATPAMAAAHKSLGHNDASMIDGVTVNSFTPAEEAHARSAVTEAGYKPSILEFAQAGNLFFTATRDDNIYEVTVTPSGKTFASTGLPVTNATNRDRTPA